jgi:hypothetical protein
MNDKETFIYNSKETDTTNIFLDLALVYLPRLKRTTGEQMNEELALGLNLFQTCPKYFPL